MHGSSRSNSEAMRMNSLIGKRRSQMADATAVRAGTAKLKDILLHLNLPLFMDIGGFRGM